MTALTSAEISLPAEADGQRVSDRIAVLADTVDVVGLTDNHAGQPRMSSRGSNLVQSQMVFDLPRLEAFLARGEDMLVGVRVYASVALLRSERMAERACALPGVTIPEPACAQIRRDGGIELAREVAAEFRVTRGINSRRR